MCLSCSVYFRDRIAPYCVHAGCALGAFASMRRLVVPRAAGHVIEVGVGSGLNLPFYDFSKIDRLVGIDPDDRMLGIACRKAGDASDRVTLLNGVAEDLAVDSATIDAAVVTYALCTIPEPDRALREIRRVLKPDGRLLFVEHGRSDQALRARVQDSLNGVWGILAAGCNLIRQPPRMIEAAGMTIRTMERKSFPVHLWPLGQHFAGEAVVDG